MKVILIILDGLSERPCPQLNYQTPLMASYKPNLDRLAALGINGYMYPIAPGIAPSTDLAHFVLWGYSLEEYPGRGVIEAWGEDRKVEDYQVVLRASLVSVEENDGQLNIVARDIPVTEKELQDLTSSIDAQSTNNTDIKYYYSQKRQGFLFIEGKTSSLISDSDPFDTNLPVLAVQPLAEAADSEEAINTAISLNKFLLNTYKKLDNHPVNNNRRRQGLLPLNCLVTKWAGKARALDTFEQKNSMKGAVIASGTLLKGLAKSLGMDFYLVEEGKNCNLSMKKRCEKAIELINKDYSFVHIHTKAPDEAAHTKNPLAKKEIIEKLDTSLSPLLEKEVYKESLLIITSDHSTPSTGNLIHSGEPVPIVAIGPGVGRDEVESFDEQSSRKGAIGPIYGKDLMPIMLNYTDRIKFLGTHSFTKDFLARPSVDRITPLKLDT